MSATTMTTTFFQRMRQHADWANQRALTMLQQLPEAAPRLGRLAGHLLTTEQIYLERMRGRNPWPQDFWPELEAAALPPLARANQAGYAEFLAEQAAADFDHVVSYRNSRGAVQHTSTADLFLHVAMHGSYHRGQLALAVRQTGSEPVNTDFITFAREGHEPAAGSPPGKKYLTRLFHYVRWANNNVLQLLQMAPAAPTVLRFLAHLLAAEQVWLTRLRGEDSAGLAIWPDLALPACMRLLEANAAGYQSYLEESAEESLAAIITYRNSKGMEFHSVAADILAQVVLHGAYHRGQIAWELRRAGDEPVNTDYVVFVREAG